VVVLTRGDLYIWKRVRANCTRENTTWRQVKVEHTEVSRGHISQALNAYGEGLNDKVSNIFNFYIGHVESRNFILLDEGQIGSMNGIQR